MKIHKKFLIYLLFYNYNDNFILCRFQTPGTIVFTWDKPKMSERNGKIIMYHVLFKKNVILNNNFKFDRNVTEQRIVFNGLEENMDYSFMVMYFNNLINYQ